MKHLKLYEGYMVDMFNELELVKSKYRKELEACLQVLIDDYGFKYSKLEDGEFVYTTKDNEEIVITDDFINTFKLAIKKIEKFGLLVSFYCNGSFQIGSAEYLFTKWEDVKAYPDKYSKVLPDRFVIAYNKIHIFEPYKIDSLKTFESHKHDQVKDNIQACMQELSDDYSMPIWDNDQQIGCSYHHDTGEDYLLINEKILNDIQNCSKKLSILNSKYKIRIEVGAAFFIDGNMEDVEYETRQFIDENIKIADDITKTGESLYGKLYANAYSSNPNGRELSNMRDQVKRFISEIYIEVNY